MRERKFRGLDNMGYWVYGDLIQYESGETAILNRFSSYGSEATEILRRSKVIPETVGQFTGLKDKNDTDIYEGDCDSRDRFIDFRDGCFHVVQESGQTFDFLCHMSHFEVTGTIHDKPELMEARECK